MDTATKTLDTILPHEPLVSILMLTYNRADYLRTAIESVISQTYTNWELVVIDDGSTDDTPAIVKGFHESRIRYIRHDENAGLHTRRKESLQHVRGSYIAVLDSDDVWTDPEKLSQQVAFMEAHNECVLLGTFTKLIDEHGTTLGTSTFATGDLPIREKILFRNQFTHSSVLMRTETVAKTAGYQPLLAEDLELFLQLGEYGSFANLPNPMTAHRVHSKSMNDHGIKMCSAVHTIIKRHRNYPHFYHALFLSHLRLWYCRLRSVISRK